jgi:hypothetical protein
MTQWKLVPDWPLPVQINTAHDQFGMEGPDPELVYRAMVTSPFHAPDVIGALEGLINNACTAGRSGPSGSVIVTSTAKEWQAHLEATDRARSVLSQLKGEGA